MISDKTTHNKEVQVEPMHDFQGPFTTEMWAALDSFLTKLPEKVRLVVWASERNSCTEGNAVDLCRIFADRYDMIDFKNRPRKADYPYYPVIGIMGFDEEGKEVDYGVRFLGHPAWYQINSLVGAMQAVAFKGMTLEALTRIHLSRLKDKVLLELFTTPENESGVLMATLIANITVVSPHIRCFIVMINDFPKLAARYSVYSVPHTIINRRNHLTGNYDEDQFLKQIAQASKL